MKIALVHDYLREYGGAERVVEVMHEIWPKAPLYTSFVDWEALGVHASRFRDWDIRPSWVQNNPLVKKLHSPLRFLAARIWESFDFKEYDVVLSSSGWFISRGVQTVPPTVHICYLHHPPRNLYGYATGSYVQKYWPVRVYASLVNFYMRHYDFQTAQRVNWFIANSQETARRIEKFYRRKAAVIYPPINMPKIIKTNKKKEYFLSVGRLAWAKRVDLAIAACKRLKLPLKIVGSGMEEGALRKIAARPPSAGAEGAAGWRPKVEFLGAVSDAELSRLYAGAKALIFCALDEDFGMVPVEAMAAGVPVIALGQGGVLETVIEGKTGVLFKKPEVADLIAAIKRFMSLSRNWAGDCRAQAQKFSKERFKRELKNFVEEKHREKTFSST